MPSLRIFYKGWNYSQDGPGNRLVYHLQGCNFHCPWCSNPEGMSMTGTLLVKEGHLLESICPFGAVSGNGLNRSQCNVCQDRVCIKKNRNVGMRWSCEECDIEDIINEAESSRSLFYDGGGVTFTGGEATLQFRPLMALMSSLHEKGINMVLETNGSHPRLPELLSLLDLLIVDLKHYDNSLHKKVVGADVWHTQSNIRKAISTSAVNILIRIPLIPGFNDGDDNIRCFTSLLAEYDRERFCVELLKYHEYGKSKWKECGMDYTMPSVKISDEDWLKYETMFKNEGYHVINT